jgi:hypothetical protein
VNFAAGAKVGTFSFASAVTTSPGDVVQVLAPASVDATFAGPLIALAGSTSASAGGVNTQTAAYNVGTIDRSGLVVMNSASATTGNLPMPTGSSGNFPNGWRTEFMNVGAGTVTIAVPSGVSLNGTLNGTKTVAQGAGCRVWTDGINWFAY